MDIKEELGLCSENKREGFMKEPVNNIKIETVTSSSDYHTDIKIETVEEADVYNLHSLDQTELSSEDPVMGYHKNEVDTKIEIKEEQWWLETSSTQTTCSNDIKDRPEDFHFLESTRLKKVDVSSYRGELFTNEDLESNTSFNIGKDSSGCTDARQCHGEKIPDDGEIVSMPSCLKQNNLLQQSNTNIQDINKDKCKVILSNVYEGADKRDIFPISFRHCCHFKNHRLVHDNEVNKCEICEEGFAQLQLLKRRKSIPGGINPQKCNICEKAFTRLQDLKRHKLIHEGIKPHKCNLCNKAFTRSQDLKIHKLIHEGIKPHKCNICNKPFTKLQDLKRHNLIHEGIKPHKCNLCNKTFTQLNNLKRHKLFHEGIKPHKCNICDKAFTKLQDLKRHKLIHEGIKPHKCNLCNKAFTRLQDLKTHKLIHEGIKPHKCNICNKAFTQLSTLRRHKLIHGYSESQ